MKDKKKYENSQLRIRILEMLMFLLMRVLGVVLNNSYLRLG
jgi:hypothetical protein